MLAGHGKADARDDVRHARPLALRRFTRSGRGSPLLDSRPPSPRGRVAPVTLGVAQSPESSPISSIEQSRSSKGRRAGSSRLFGSGASVCASHRRGIATICTASVGVSRWRGRRRPCALDGDAGRSGMVLWFSPAAEWMECAPRVASPMANIVGQSPPFPDAGGA